MLCYSNGTDKYATGSGFLTRDPVIEYFVAYISFGHCPVPEMTYTVSGGT